MTAISSVPALSATDLAAAPSMSSATTIANQRARQSNALRATLPSVDLMSSQRRMSASTAAGTLYGPRAADLQLHTEHEVHIRHKRFVPVMLAADGIATNVIDQVSAAITANTVGTELIADVGTYEVASFPRATVMAAASGGQLAGQESGMAAGAWAGAESGALEGAQAGAARGALAGGIKGGSNGALAGSLMSDGELEGAVWGEMAGIRAGRAAGKLLGRTIGTGAGRDAGARSGAAYGAAAGGIAGQQAGILAGRMVADNLLLRLPVEERDDIVQVWSIAETHQHAATVAGRETAARAAHEVGTIAGERAGILAGRRMGLEVGGRDGELAGARAGGEAGHLAGIRAGEVIGRLARDPRSQPHISENINAILLAGMGTGPYLR